MRKIILTLMALSCFMLSAQVFAKADKCSKLTKRKMRLEKRNKTNSWRYQKIVRKLANCDANNKQFDKSSWKSGKADRKSARRCHRVLKRMKRKCRKKPNGKRCRKLEEKSAKLGCEVADDSSGD